MPQTLKLVHCRIRKVERKHLSIYGETMLWKALRIWMHVYLLKPGICKSIHLELEIVFSQNLKNINTINKSARYLPLQDCLWKAVTWEMRMWKTLCSAKHSWKPRHMNISLELPWGFPGGSVVKNLPANTGDTRDPGLVRFLGWEGPLEKEMTIHFSILGWKIPWTE